MGETLEGCFKDKSKRDIPFHLKEATGNPRKCFELAVKSGYKYVGLQNGGECWAGNAVGKYGQVKDSECSMPCAMDNTKHCGAAWRNSVYKLASIAGSQGPAAPEEGDSEGDDQGAVRQKQ